MGDVLDTSLEPNDESNIFKRTRLGDSSPSSSSSLPVGEEREKEDPTSNQDQAPSPPSSQDLSQRQEEGSVSLSQGRSKRERKKPSWQKEAQSPPHPSAKKAQVSFELTEGGRSPKQQINNNNNDGTDSIHLAPWAMIRLAQGIGYELKFDENGDIIIPVVPPSLDPNVPREVIDPLAKTTEDGEGDIFLEASRESKLEDEFDPNKKRKRTEVNYLTDNMSEREWLKMQMQKDIDDGLVKEPKAKKKKGKNELKKTGKKSIAEGSDNNNNNNKKQKIAKGGGGGGIEENGKKTGRGQRGPAKQKTTLSDLVYQKFAILFRYIRCLSEENKDVLTLDYVEEILTQSNQSNNGNGNHDYLKIEENQLPELYEEEMDPSQERYANAFVYKVNKQHYPDYYILITNPIDLNTIRRSILKKQYYFVREFYEDMMRLFDNAMIYNAPESLIFVYADTMKKSFERAWEFTLKDDMEMENQNDRTGNVPG